MISICGQRGASSAAREARDVSAGTTWVKTLWGHRAGIRLTAKDVKRLENQIAARHSVETLAV